MRIAFIKSSIPGTLSFHNEAQTPQNLVPSPGNCRVISLQALVLEMCLRTSGHLEAHKHTFPYCYYCAQDSTPNSSAS